MSVAIRKLEKESIRAFLEENSDRINGQVLDFGSGKQPYRDIVEARHAEYTPYDMTIFPASTALEDSPLPDGKFDVVICTQVLQYTYEPLERLTLIHHILEPGGWLLMTGPTCWPVVEVEDLWRFTPAGVRALLRRAEFREIQVQPRGGFNYQGEVWHLGWAALAQR